MTLIKINPKDYSLEETKASEIQEMFSPMLDKMVELENEYNEVTSLEISNESCKKAKTLRLKYVKVRTGTAEIHKKLKANSLAVGRFLDGFKNAQLMASSGIESKLSDIEKHFEKIEEQRIEALQIERENELESYAVAVIPSNLGIMEQSTWDIFLTGTKANFEAIKAAEKLEEEQLIADQKASELKAKQEKEERAKIEAENAKLRKEASDKEAIRQKEIAEQVAKDKAANDLIQAEKEKAAKLQKAIDDEKERQEHIELKQKFFAESEERKAAAAPDKEKILLFARALAELERPSLTTEHGAFMLNQIDTLLNKVDSYIKESAEKF